MTFISPLPCVDEVVCFIALSSTTFSAFEDEGVVTICLDLLSRDIAVDVSVQLETVTGSGTATGIKYKRACICHNTVFQYHLQYSICAVDDIETQYYDKCMLSCI